MAKKKIELPAIKPNYAIGLNYQKTLARATRMMMADIIQSILEAYDTHEDAITNIVGDANPISSIAKIISTKFKYWQSFFNKKSTDIAVKFVGNVKSNTLMQLKKSLKEAPEDIVKELLVKFDKDSERALLASQSVIEENVNLITSIPADIKVKIQSAVNLAMQRGRDKTYLKAQLEELSDMSAKRVELISRDQINKATAVINASKQADIGITKNQWKHSSAGKTFRKSHVEASGTVYDIKKGCFIDGEYIYPGQLINCRCYSTPVLEFEI